MKLFCFFCDIKAYMAFIFRVYLAIFINIAIFNISLFFNRSLKCVFIIFFTVSKRSNQNGTISESMFTLIDNIFVKLTPGIPHGKGLFGNIYINISNHLANLCIIEVHDKRSNTECLDFTTDVTSLTYSDSRISG